MDGQREKQPDAVRGLPDGAVLRELRLPDAIDLRDFRALVAAGRARRPAP